jgi:alpha-beta hydrolase superfamily lysophospholipase
MSEHTFTCQAGKHPLFARCWMPDGPLQAGIALVHGQGEHCGRYEAFASWFGERGVGVIGLDHFGHGKSPGRRGHVPSYDDYQGGVDALLREFRERRPGLPVFLYGQSMGGNLVIHYVLERGAPNLVGAVASSPWLRLAFQPPAFKVALAGVMNKIFPAYSEPNGLDANDLSRDPAVCEAYRKDPLVHDRISAGAFFAVHHAGLHALEHASGLNQPLLIMHGTADRLTSCDASREFCEKSGAAFRSWDGAYHELHNEPDRELYLQAAWDWMQQVLSKRSESALTQA